MNRPYSAIIFDLGGVILNIDYHKTSQAFKKLGVTSFDDIYTQAKQSHLFDSYETGKISSSDFRQQIRELSGLNLSDIQIDEAWNAMLLDLPEGRLELLKSLSQEMPIFLYSNTNEIHYNAFRDYNLKTFGNKELLEEIFNQTYYSHHLQMRKPHAEGFEHIIQINGLTPEKTLFIDDSEQHLIGAKKVGLQTHWLKEGDIRDILT